jgi:hypothetical protein
MGHDRTPEKVIEITTNAPETASDTSKNLTF